MRVCQFRHIGATINILPNYLSTVNTFFIHYH
ncbi:hypothetical protein B23_0894 [Geobacillus thermoleovorans B23]|nr:hypothetical protein B23_0894 [Geobacillus thermoleovorans B23]